MPPPRRSMKSGLGESPAGWRDHFGKEHPSESMEFPTKLPMKFETKFGMKFQVRFQVRLKRRSHSSLF